MNKLIDTEGLLVFKTEVVDPAIAAAVSGVDHQAAIEEHMNTAHNGLATETYVNNRIPELPVVDPDVEGSFLYVLKAVVDSEQHVTFTWELLPSDLNEG